MCMCKLLRREEGRKEKKVRERQECQPVLGLVCYPTHEKGEQWEKKKKEKVRTEREEVRPALGHFRQKSSVSS